MLEVDTLDEELQLAAIADTYEEVVPQRTRTLRPNDHVWHPRRHLLAKVRRTIPFKHGVMVKLMTRDDEPIMGWYWQHNLMLCNAAGVEVVSDDVSQDELLQRGA
jgi:hypothetical protein